MILIEYLFQKNCFKSPDAETIINHIINAKLPNGCIVLNQVSFNVAKKNPSLINKLTDANLLRLKPNSNQIVFDADFLYSCSN